MNGFAFRTSLIFDWAGSPYRIDRLAPHDQVVLERLLDGQIVLSTRTDLMAAYREGKIVVGGDTNSNRPSEQHYGRPIAELPEHIQTELKRRAAYIYAMEENGPFVFTLNSLGPLITEVAERIGDIRPPSVVTLYRWNIRYKRSHEIRSLIPRHDLRGRSGPQQHSRCLELAADATREAFEASPGASVQSIYDRLVGKIRAENRTRLPDDQIRVPALRTMYRLMGRMEAYDVAVLKDGKANADRRFHVVRRGPITSCILERIEVDHTPLDLFLVDQATGLPLGRPILTVFIDVFSRFPLGYFLNFAGTSAAAVIGGLRHSILPKEPAIEVLPNLSIKHAWPCYGVMDSLVLDNGLEFHGGDLDGIAYDLGIRLQYCPKRKPRFKGVIERYLKTINYFFTHQLPGTSLARLAERGDYDPAKHALLTLSEFRHVCEKWLLDIYAQTRHRGIETTPWAKWHEGLTSRTPELPGSASELQRRIGLVRERTLSHQGIALNGLHYAGPELIPVIRAWGPGVKVRIVFDPDDLGCIHVWPPQQQEPIVVEAINSGYARGLTLYQHELIRQQIRENGRAAENLDALVEAKYQLSQAIDEMLRSRKFRSRRRGAHLQGVNSRNPSARMNAPIPDANSRRPSNRRSFNADSETLPEPLPSFILLPKAKGV